MEVYREILPESYLLILVDNLESDPAAESVLHQALRRAGHSGKTSVWLDCTNVNYLPGQIAPLLARYARRLGRRGVSLILCHLSDAMRQQLLARTPDLSPRILPTLLDAQRYCQQRVNHPGGTRQLAG
jgi:anti-anti-sigma regulatory factor